MERFSSHIRQIAFHLIPSADFCSGSFYVSFPPCFLSSYGVDSDLLRIYARGFPYIPSRIKVFYLNYYTL
ncbi:hypothetical protein COCMIDRAFT_98800 [Bipolaris oryzae ATCC 44560]|uniref:Uncharacterized protein n=1 Tax=Bipolaris oryzae ATCC 44560 TaxID=930090 RepID=W6YXX8_COCMI|nr:uncharacterized protein COCMIDRAFT_98800 [Bipolaris oryzae ATCC 44560]EUC44192.1 hypothetical protein COCMIDRAFT_98800 [Bipolaris oryzae ATCC 44560]